ncbi:hypothetical protein H477_3326 [[Clostridium] sordellii ATCC 9714]|nr:hypothetical protein H477_3326 [[Clostridium] sordellii ATCC 9714] [Paeniclostridium sordellii ATCC 9714]
MIKYESFGVKPCLYAATNGGNVQILKSTNGVNWFKLDSKNLKGSTSRAMTIHNGKLYLATVDQESDDISKLYKPLIYSSSDPELYGWDKIKIGTKKIKIQLDIFMEWYLLMESYMLPLLIMKVCKYGEQINLILKKMIGL